MKSIYKITNKINHKVYIGISNNPKRRWAEHCLKTTEYISLINKAINKYGVENFSFEILENYNSEELAKKREKELIAEFRSLAPFGYNIDAGGGEPPHPKGENHPMAKITEDQAN